MDRNGWREQALTKMGDIYVENRRGQTEARRCDTAAQIRRILAPPAPGESWDMLAEAGVPEKERDIRSAIIVRQAVRTLDGDMRVAEKVLEGVDREDAITYLPEKERDREDGGGG